MSIWHTLGTAFRAIGGHRLRSVLTTLGILFGIAAVICTVGVGTASSASINQRFAGLGTDLLTVTPGTTTTGGVTTGAGTASTLTVADVTALSDPRSTPDVATVAPVVQSRQTLAEGASSWTTTVQGSTAGWLDANARALSSGVFLSPDDVAGNAQRVVLGSTAAGNLGAHVGDTVSIGGTPFVVAGILQSSGGLAFANQDDLAVIPLTTAQDMFNGGNYASVQRILLSARSSDVIGAASGEADAVLRNVHGIAPGATADYTIQTQTSFLSTARSISQTLSVLLASIAAISLLVGGIGVMNIMLVSVTERTTEIGLRKALGATPADLVRQFLVEAATLSSLGGLLGVALALGAGVVLPRVANIGITITVVPVAVSVAVAAGVGLVFGVVPALRAARLTPITALRGQ